MLKLFQYLLDKKHPFTVSADQSVYFQIRGIQYRVSGHGRTQFLGFKYTEKQIDKCIEDIERRKKCPK